MIQKKKIIASLILAITIAFLAAFFLTEEQREKQRWEHLIIEISKDAHLKVSDLDIVIPLVALLEPKYAHTPQSFPPWNTSNKKYELAEKRKFKELSAKRDTAPQVKRVRIQISQYQHYGERLVSLKICPLLQRDWAKNFCKGEFKELMEKLPETFYIVDEKHIDTFRNHFTVGGEKTEDQIKKLNLKQGAANISCDADGKFCTAGIRTSPNTLAIWTVWQDAPPQMSALQRAQSQGNAILAFIKHGIGIQPNFEKMQKEMGFTSR